jgi:hypothetical protein
MDLDHITQVVEQLALDNIPSLVVGELALNYYNVPRVVHVSPGFSQSRARLLVTIYVSMLKSPGNRALHQRE